MVRLDWDSGTMPHCRNEIRRSYDCVRLSGAPACSQNIIWTPTDFICSSHDSDEIQIVGPPQKLRCTDLRLQGTSHRIPDTGLA